MPHVDGLQGGPNRTWLATREEQCEKRVIMERQSLASEGGALSVSTFTSAIKGQAGPELTDKRE